MTKYEKYGVLHVDAKGQLVDRNGEVVVLRGFSTHGLSWYPEYVNRDFFEFMQDEWKIDLVRLAMYTDEEDGYCVGTEANKEKLLKVIDDGVKAATELGLYVIIDWHILKNSNPKIYKEEALDFFAKVSKKYAAYGNVFYEICNEPNVDCTWEDIKSYAEEVIPVIRENAKYNPILVGTCSWSQRLDWAWENPLTCDKNLLYVCHFYAMTHKDELRARVREARKRNFPVFVSEFGTMLADGQGGHSTEEAEKWMELLDELNISRAMWAIANRDESCASFLPTCTKIHKGFTEDDMRDSAKWYVGYLKKVQG